MPEQQDKRMTVSVFDTKPYDREYLSHAAEGGDIDFRFHEFRLEVATATAAQGAQAACIFVNDHADAPVLEMLAGSGVKHLALRCAGFNQVDLAAAATLGIKVTRVPSYSPHAVAEHTVALLLSLNRKIHRSYNRVRDFNFSLGGLVGFDLFGKTAGIIGTGKTGRLVAEILRGFKMDVLVYDTMPDKEWADAMGCVYVELDELFKRSDIVSLHVPLMPETAHMINAQSLAMCKRGVYILNVSRGRIIHTKELLDALKSGHVGGVALDVYEEEEGVFFEDLSGQVLQDDELARLLTFPNVLITAHQAFLTHEALSEIARVSVGNMLALARGGEALEGTLLESA